MSECVKQELVPFLRDLANSLEENKLNNTQLLQISEFFMSFSFKKDQGEYSSEELIKFLSLGWYIYTHLLNSTE